MARKIVEQEVPWRGSINDLATDVSYLLTPKEGEELIAHLQRYLREPHLADKWQGKGHRIDPDEPE